MSEIRIAFDGASAAEGNRLAPNLQASLSGVAGIKTTIVREREDAQDAGTIISIVLGAPAIAATVKALGAWLTRANQTGVTLMLPDGTVVLKNMRSEDVAKAITALEKALPRI